MDRFIPCMTYVLIIICVVSITLPVLWGAIHKYQNSEAITIYKEQECLK